ncbi:MAG: hypothetical protein KBG54_01725 [Oscillospiraceae bacterium]|nr:hypothetical protein [Oscillospiraceae bacterium]
MNKKHALRLFIGAYALALAGLLLFSLYSFVSDNLMRATGALETREYTLDTLTLQDFTQTGENTAVTTSVDPQLLINDFNARGTMLRVDMQFDQFPGEVSLYYTRGEEEFSLEQRLWAKQKNDGVYEFILPRGKISRLRIDPSNFINVTMQINSFTVNPQRSFGSYFAYSGETLFNLAVWPPLAAAALAFFYTAFFSKKLQDTIAVNFSNAKFKKKED